MQQSKLGLGAAKWFLTPDGSDFLVWLEDELELKDTLTPQELYNKYRSSDAPPVAIDPMVMAVREGRRQVFGKILALRDMAKEQE
jgi:hypothetical protein